ncbi:MAG: non-heme iron oxygenase ferredoxin subunit [Candidatus Latescibacteria bacterium]|nr:non-heme iron oxygenase ferredoxin subunit [Candidatus Latescibacterota bacterium]
MGQYVKAATTDELQAGQGKLVEIEGKEIALFHVDGQYYAIENTCTHQGGPLCEGELEGTEVMCPWHGARFDVTSGAVLSPPAYMGVTSFPVRVSASDIEIEV